MTPERAREPLHEVNRPKGYNSHPSNVETKEVTRYLSCMLGSAVKYVWRAGLKDDLIKDLKKAAWCFNDEAERLAEDAGGSFEINGKWVEPAERVVQAMTTNPNELLLRVVLGELLLARYYDQDCAASVRRCRDFVNQRIAQVEQAASEIQPA